MKIVNLWRKHWQPFSLGLSTLALLLLVTASANAQLIRREFIDPFLTPILYASLPVSPRTGDPYWISDMNSSCTAGGSTNNVIVVWTGTAWVCSGSVGAGAGSQTLTQTLALGRTDTTLVSEATALQLGDGTRRVDFWCDATDGCVRKPNPLADTTIPIWTNFKFNLRDIEAGLNVLEIDPDAATRRDMYKYTNAAYRPWKQIFIPISYFAPDGTHCPTTISDAPINGAQHEYVTCAVNAAAELRSRQILMDLGWDRGVVRAAAVMSDPDGGANATGDVYVQCRGSGEAVADVWSTAAAVDITFATANAPTWSTVTGDITAAGTCGANPTLWLEWRMDNGNWTAGTNVKILGFVLFYREEAWSRL